MQRKKLHVQAISFAFELSVFALTVEHAVQISPRAISTQIDTFLLVGNWISRVMMIGSKEHMRSVMIDMPRCQVSFQIRK